MYLRTFFRGNNVNSLYRNLNRKFSILDKLGRDTLSFRMTKYDPTKELEVSFKIYTNKI